MEKLRNHLKVTTRARHEGQVLRHRVGLCGQQFKSVDTEEKWKPTERKLIPGSGRSDNERTK